MVHAIEAPAAAQGADTAQPALDPAGQRRATRSSPRIPRFQRDGTLFLAVTFLVGVAALNTGNNLLYLVLILLLSFFVCSGLLALSTLSKLTVHRRAPSRVFAGSPALGEILVGNGKKLVPSYSILVADLAQGRPAPVALHHLARLPAREETAAIVEYLFPRRGVERLKGLRVTTRFPFGFLERGRLYWRVDDVLVYPRVDPLQGEDLVRAIGLEGEASRMKGMGQDVYSIRRFVQGDPLKHVSWKQTAKHAQFMVKDFESEERRRLSLVLDLAPCLRGEEPSAARGRGASRHPRAGREGRRRGAGGARQVEGTGNGRSGAADGGRRESTGPKPWEERVEGAIRLAASYASHFLGHGFSVRFATHGAAVPFGAGPEQTDRILAILARLDPYGITGLGPIPEGQGEGLERVSAILVRAGGTGAGMADSATFHRVAEV